MCVWLGDFCVFVGVLLYGNLALLLEVLEVLRRSRVEIFMDFLVFFRILLGFFWIFSLRVY